MKLNSQFNLIYLIHIDYGVGINMAEKWAQQVKSLIRSVILLYCVTKRKIKYDEI
jgi:hypothetical protein